MSLPLAAACYIAGDDAGHMDAAYAARASILEIVSMVRAAPGNAQHASTTSVQLRHQPHLSSIGRAGLDGTTKRKEVELVV